MKKIKTISDQIWRAMQTKNIEVLSQLIHEEALFIHMGETFSRDEELEIIKEGEIIYKTIELEETTSKKIESTVVLLNKLKLTAIVKGVEVTNPFVVTEIYTAQDDNIKLVSMAYTRINY
ncbi:nuclear transport factor 2 family protein [Enterococcus casseliflavus]|nr:nuclear transport factor 2 family protein [Enterococcus casseliflavus]